MYLDLWPFGEGQELDQNLFTGNLLTFIIKQFRYFYDLILLILTVSDDFLIFATGS